MCTREDLFETTNILEQLCTVMSNPNSDDLKILDNYSTILESIDKIQKKQRNNYDETIEGMFISNYMLVLSHFFFLDRYFLNPFPLFYFLCYFH